VRAPRRTELRDWYRESVRERLAQLNALLVAVGRRDREAELAARETVETLRGSGGSYGFEAVTRAAELVVSAERDLFYPRLTGFLDVLRDVTEGGSGGGSIPHGWLVHAAAPFPEGTALAVRELETERDTRNAWRRAAALLGIDEEALCARVADALGICSADVSDPSPAAARLVPLSLVEAGPVLPLHEDGRNMVAAASNPTDLRLVAALERITARRAVLHVATPGRLQVAVLRHLPESGETAAGQLRASRAGTGPLTVLVVDDDAGTRHLVRAVLERDGYTVIEAADGIEALERVDESPEIDLVVVDLYMPLMDGREVVRRMRDAGKDHSILVLTGAQRTETETQLIEEGADDYLRKPLDPRLFLARVSAVLRRRGRG